MTQDDSKSGQASRCRICFVNRFYAPDSSATSQILTDVAEWLADRSYRVTVFTSRFSYDGEHEYPKLEHLNGVTIRRVWSTGLGRDSTLRRSIDYLTFYASISINMLFGIMRGDIIIAKTDPPILSIPLGVVARIRGAILVNWLQDLFPEVAIELGLGSRKGIAIRLLKYLRDRSFERAKMNVTIGSRMAEFVSRLKVPTDQICVIENFVDDNNIRMSNDHSNDLRDEWGIKASDFVIGYSGNLGRAHDIDTILDVAEQLRKSSDVKFLFIGGGFQHARLLYEIEQRQLPNIFLKQYQPRSRLNESLALPNLHWASLAPSLEGYIVPSKVYGIAAAGRPLLMIGDKNGEVGRILSKFAFGKCVPKGATAEAIEFILYAKQNPEKSLAMGLEARNFIDSRGSRKQAMQSWESLVRNLASNV